jgi:FAD/FMN-containing dehydrogenase
MVPTAVHAPHDRQEVINLAKECRDKNRPLLSRGAGTSLTGQSINEAVLLDLSQHFNKVLEVNVEGQWVRVEPGVVCADLNAQIKSTGLHFAPNPEM